MPKFKDAALNISTLGYYGMRQQVRSEQKAAELAQRTQQLEARSLDLELELKALRDSTAPGGVRVIQTDTFGPGEKELKKKSPTTVKALRELAENSVWIRSALDIYRDVVANAECHVMPFDDKKKMDKGVARELEELLAHPNPKNEPYNELKEMMVEDYLVVGLGVMEEAVRRDTTPYELHIMDAARFGIYPDWNGDLSKPHFAEIDTTTGKAIRSLADPQAMVLMNRRLSYSSLGLSHVESLVKTIIATLEGDEYLKNQVLNASPKGLLNLGEGISQSQIDEARSRIMNTKYPFVITGGTKNPQYIPLALSPEQLKILEAQTWFVREIAAIFKIPTAMLQLAVDTSRANTEAMIQNAEAMGLSNLLWRIRALENMEIVLRYGPYAKHNCKLDYPILSAKDAQKQAEVTRTQMGGKAWSTPNEARAANGLPAIDSPIYNQVIWDDGKNGPIPLEALEARYYDESGKLKEPEPEPEDETTQGQGDGQQPQEEQGQGEDGDPEGDSQQQEEPKTDKPKDQPKQES